MAEHAALQRAGNHIERNTAEGSARQHNGDQIYSQVGNLHQGDAYYNSQSGPAYIPRSGYLSPQRWIDEPKNNTAIIEAAKHGQLQRLASLLKQPDKNVDYLDTEGMSALHYAVQNAHVEAVKMLLDQGGANPGRQESRKTGPAPLALAARGGHAEIVRLLLRAGAPIVSIWVYLRRSNWERVSVMAEAIIGGNTEVIAELVKCGAVLNECLNAPLQDEIKPLTLAIIVGPPELVELLLDLVAELTWHLRLPVPFAEEDLPSGSRFSSGRVKEGYLEISPLALAISRQNGVRMLETLLKRKPPSSLQHEAFHLAAMAGDLDAMECLLQSGTNVDCSHGGVHALHLCSYFGITAAVERLLKHGADPLIAWIVKGFFNQRNYTILRPGYRSLWRTTVLTVVGPFTYPLALLVQSDAPNKPWQGGFYPIHLAVGHPEVLKLFIASNVNTNLQTLWSEYTPLHVAASWLEPVSARYLLDCGASLHSKSCSGRTPFEVALSQRILEGYENSAKRHLLDMLRTTPLTVLQLQSLKYIPFLDPTDDGKRNVKFQRKVSPLADSSGVMQTLDTERASASSWALSERYSASSWAHSERYSTPFHHLSQDCDIEELDEEHEAFHEPILTAITEDPSHGGKTDGVSSDNTLDSVANVVADLDLGSKQRHELVKTTKASTVASKRRSRWFGPWFLSRNGLDNQF